MRVTTDTRAVHLTIPKPTPEPLEVRVYDQEKDAYDLPTRDELPAIARAVLDAMPEKERRRFLSDMAIRACADSGRDKANLEMMRSERDAAIRDATSGTSNVGRRDLETLRQNPVILHRNESANDEAVVAWTKRAIRAETQAEELEKSLQESTTAYGRDTMALATQRNEAMERAEKAEAAASAVGDCHEALTAANVPGDGLLERVRWVLDRRKRDAFEADRLLGLLTEQSRELADQKAIHEQEMAQDGRARAAMVELCHELKLSIYDNAADGIREAIVELREDISNARKCERKAKARAEKAEIHERENSELLAEAEGKLAKLDDLAKAYAIEGDYTDGEEPHMVLEYIITRLQQVAAEKARALQRWRPVLDAARGLYERTDDKSDVITAWHPRLVTASDMLQRLRRAYDEAAKAGET